MVSTRGGWGRAGSSMPGGEVGLGAEETGSTGELGWEDGRDAGLAGWATGSLSQSSSIAGGEGAGGAAAGRTAASWAVGVELAGRMVACGGRAGPRSGGEVGLGTGRVGTVGEGGLMGGRDAGLAGWATGSLSQSSSAMTRGTWAAHERKGCEA